MQRSLLATPQGRYCLVNLDQAASFASQAKLNLADPAGLQQVQETLQTLWQGGRQPCTGVIADPQFSWPLVSRGPDTKGVALVLNQSTAEQDPMVPPSLNGDWTVESVANNYALAYLDLWYNPAEEAALAKKQLLAEVADYCRQEDTDLVLRLRLYQPTAPGQPATPVPIETWLTALQEVRELTQLLVLDFPGDSLTAATITAELDQPWLVWLGEQPYLQAKETLRQALESGAAGCVMSEVLWADRWLNESAAAQLEQTGALPGWFATEVHDRALELARIVAEHAVTGAGPLSWT